MSPAPPRVESGWCRPPANGQSASAAYLRDPDDGRHRAPGVMVFAIDAVAISGIVGFADASLFEQFGLPVELER